ncbi:MAG TPA: DUF4364 domain-containing protein [Ruminococcaceae bacterium]|nr:DUF4364 domain-containing protein [Oscillospiraceae bacterium]
MSGNSFNGGVAPGGLRNVDEVKLLICYLLKSTACPLSLDTLSESLQQDGLANYFTIADALHALLVTGHVDLLEQNGEKTYKVTGLGAGTANLFERRLPYSVREKAVKAAMRLLAQQKREAENHVQITADGVGFRVICSVLDGKDSLLSISLLVSDRPQAEAVKKQFMSDPTTIYRATVALMTGDPSAVGNALKSNHDA